MIRVAPTSLSLPLLGGLMVFVVAVVTTQIAVAAKSADTTRSLERLGQVYMDGLMAKTRAALDSGEARTVQAAFDAAMEEQQGVRERALVALRPSGEILAQSGDPSLGLEALEITPGEARFDAAQRLVWAARDASGGTLIAALDARDVVADRRALFWSVVIADLLIAAFCAWIAAALLARITRPLALISNALGTATQAGPAPIPVAAAGSDRAARRHIEAFNAMAAAVQERERLAAELTDKQRQAALGRLAATLAHEIRNPLGGMAAAVSTLDKFGDDREARTEAIGFLKRAVSALEATVASTLKLYRPPEDRRFGPADVEDVRRLAAVEAQRKGVALSVVCDVPAPIDIETDGLRRILLNLLLNAIAATPSGRGVRLEARATHEALAFAISDDGPGIEAARALQLEGRTPAATAEGLGIGIVVELLAELEGRASVSRNPDGGSRIDIVVPLGAPS